MFDGYGNFLGEIPSECVNQCTQPGKDAYPVVSLWRDLLGFWVDRDLAIAYLTDFGCWDRLDSMNDYELSIICLWLACSDIEEQGEWLGLIP